MVWRTRYFSWLDPALLGADGQPRRRDPATLVPGVWFVGLRRLLRRRSGLVFGFPGDATTVAEAVSAHLTGRRC